MISFRHLVRGAAVAGAMLLAGPSFSTAQAAAPPQALHGAAKTAAQMAGVPASSTAPSSDPFGCPDGDICFWTGLNFTGTRCSFFNTAPNLGACTNRDLSVDNNGLPCGGCQDTLLFWGDSWTGSSFCLKFQDFRTDLRPVHFNRPGTGRGESVANNTASVRWTSC